VKPVRYIVGEQNEQNYASLMRFTFLLLLGALVFTSCSKHHVNEAGGAYAYSPDGKWMAQITDGYSEMHKLPYAVVRLWDLKKYPSLRDGVRSYSGKAPTVRLEFPQSFQARDSDCSVSWQTNSMSFSIRFSAVSGFSRSGIPSVRRLNYDLLTDTFSLRAE